MYLKFKVLNTKLLDLVEKKQLKIPLVDEAKHVGWKNKEQVKFLKE